MNWLEFFDAQGVEYTLRSPNTRVGEVSISCPFCGTDDPSYHMGVSLTENKWGCWRDGSHRGKLPTRLVRALLGCSYEMAVMLVDQFSRPDPENLDEAIALLQGITLEKPPLPTTLEYPPEFKEVGRFTRFYAYLHWRSFKHIEAFCDFYNVRCCDYGVWHDRVIFPITSRGKLVSWVGRAVGSVINAPRYRILPTKEGALVERNTMIFNEANLTGAKFLIVTEGPIDALKFDWFGDDLAHATCIFGTHLSPWQAAMIGKIRTYYDRAILLLDSDATAATFQASETLQHYDFEHGTLPNGIKDPGQMKWREIEAYLENL